MSEDVIHGLGQALAVAYEDVVHEPLSEELRDRVLELAVADALADMTSAENPALLTTT